MGYTSSSSWTRYTELGLPCENKVKHTFLSVLWLPWWRVSALFCPEYSAEDYGPLLLLQVIRSPWSLSVWGRASEPMTDTQSLFPGTSWRREMADRADRRVWPPRWPTSSIPWCPTAHYNYKQTTSITNRDSRPQWVPEYSVFGHTYK